MPLYTFAIAEGWNRTHIFYRLRWFDVFRQAFASNRLRPGVDIFSFQKLMGHTDLQVLRGYLAQTTEDIVQAQRMVVLRIITSYE